MQESVAFVASEREDLSSNSFVYSLQSIFATQVLPDLQTGSIAKADSSSTRSLSQRSNSVLPFFKDTGRDKWIFSWSLNSICHNRGIHRWTGQAVPAQGNKSVPKVPVCT